MCKRIGDVFGECGRMVQTCQAKNNPMRIYSVLLGLGMLAGGATSRAQTVGGAPTNWKIQPRKGAKTFTPSDLKAGEIFSVTIYDSAPLDGKTPGEFLRASAGTVGTKPGQLVAPLQMGAGDGRSALGSGVYRGPNGTQLVAAFNAFSLDGGKNVSIARTLTSSDAVFFRYKSSYEALLGALAERAKTEAGDNFVRVPQIVAQKMKPGGDLVPGVYAGDQLQKGQLINRFRLHVFSNGEYRLCGEDDKDIQTGGSSERIGEVSYNRVTGQLGIDSRFDLDNGYDYQFCFYGRDAAGKPIIFSRNTVSGNVSELRYVGANTKRLAPKAEKARQAAIEDEAKRYKFVTSPGKGVKDAQIQAVVHDYQMITGDDVTDEAYLLLRDGTVHKGLPVAPDELDVASSRKGEPKAWGRWTRKGEKYRVSWQNKPFEDLPGNPVLPGSAQMRLEGRFSAVRASMYWHQFWGVTFGKDGRFSKDRRGGVTTGNTPIEGGLTPRVDSTWDDGGSGTTVSGGGIGASTVQKNNSNGAREGTYSINGYTLTLRYDNGQIARLPFFFRDAKREMLWFEFNTLQLGLDD